MKVQRKGQNPKEGSLESKTVLNSIENFPNVQGNSLTDYFTDFLIASSYSTLACCDMLIWMFILLGTHWADFNVRSNYQKGEKQYPAQCHSLHLAHLILSKKSCTPAFFCCCLHTVPEANFLPVLSNIPIILHPISVTTICYISIMSDRHLSGNETISVYLHGYTSLH